MIKKLLTAALIALASFATLAPTAPVIAAQAGCVVPTTGPSTFGTVVSTYFNPCFAALLSNSSGSTAPASPTTYQWWVDTSGSTKIIKIYDSAQWIAVLSIDPTGHVVTLNGKYLALLNSSSGTTTVQAGRAARTP